MEAPIPLVPIALALLACSSPESPPESPSRPDLLLVTLDTLRADRLGAYGDSLAHTPTLDELASRSLLFREAMAPSPLTLPSHAAMLSGRWPGATGVQDNGQPVPADLPLIAEQLSAAGYAGGAFVGSYVLGRAWGLDRGFDHYDDPFHPDDVAQATSLDTVQRPGREVVRAATDWWRQQRGPRWMWVHLFDAHAPWQPSADWPAGSDPYRGDIFELDRALAPLLDAVGEQTWVIVVGDHGESLWDDGEAHHGLMLNRSALRVPLLLHPPGGAERAAPAPPRELPPRPKSWAPVTDLSPPGLELAVLPDAPRAAKVIDTPVSAIDIAPTLLEIAGLPAQGDGRSLLPSLKGPLQGRPLVAETHYPALHHGWAVERVVRSQDRWLAARGEQLLLFDPRTDPWLQEPLDEPVPASLRETLQRSTQPHSQPGELSADVRAQLAALGYVGIAPTDPGPPPSARSQVSQLHRLRRAERRLEVAPDAAREALAELVVEHPRLVDAWMSLGIAHLLTRDAAGAAAAFRAAAELAPEDPLVMWNLVISLRAAGEDAEALDLAEHMTTEQPGDPRWWRVRVDARARQEDPAGVRELSRRGLEIAPKDPYLAYMHGLAALQLGDPSAAATWLARAAEHGSRATDLPLWRGRAHQRLGEIDAAVAHYEEAARARPEDLRPVVAAALLLAEAERCREAAPYLYTAHRRGADTPELREAARRCQGRAGPP